MLGEPGAGIRSVCEAWGLSPDATRQYASWRQRAADPDSGPQVLNGGLPPGLGLTAVTVPLQADGRVIGVLDVLNFGAPFVLDDRSVAVLSLAAERIAAALENATLRDLQERREREASALLEIARATSSTLDLSEVLDRVVERTARLMSADRCSIWLLEDDGRSLVTAAISGLGDAEAVARWKQRAYRVEDEALSHHVLRTGEALAIDDALSHPLTNKDAVRWFGDQSILVVPLLCRDLPIGSLFLNHVRQPHHFTSDEIDLTLALASQAAVAIQNARLYEGSRQTSESLTRCFRQLGALATTPGLDEILQIIVEIASELIRLPYCAIRVLDDATGDLVCRAARGFPPGTLDAIRLPVGEGPSGLVVRDGQPVVIENLYATPWGRAFPFVADLGLRGYLGVPLREHGRTVGVLLACSNRPYRFGEQEIDLLQSLANQAGIAIENAELFQWVVREKEKFAAIFANSSDGIMTVNAERQITACNPTLEKLLGRRSAELVGQHCSVVLGGCARGEVARCETDCPLLDARSRRRSVANVELQTHNRDGVPVDILVSYAWVSGATEADRFGLCNIRDITEIKRVEASKSDFVSTVSHELRTPLALIKGYVTTLLRPDLVVEDDARRRYLGNIDDAANKLTRLVSDLLSVSRIETGLLEIRPRQLDLVELIRRVVDGWQFGGTSHAFDLSLPAGPIPLLADPDRIQQVLENLIGNAAKYSPPDSQIGITAKLDFPPPIVDEHGTWPSRFRPHEVLPGRWATVTVTDQGNGLTGEQMANAFAKFYRAETGLARATSGLGIGLFIAKGLVEAHDGRIWVESRPGRGSCFAFCLPLEGRR